MLKELKGLTHEQMLLIPVGQSDNVIWNVGHLLCSLSRLTYGFSGHPLPIPDSYLGLFGKGTSAAEWDEPPDVEVVLELFKALPDEVEKDYRAGRFTEYKILELAPEHTVESVEEAVAFHCFHEGLHIGMIISLKQRMGLKVSG